jgi:iron(III) transport system ATP-binding protein
MRLSDAAGPNRIKMELKTQMYLGERFELVFGLDKFLVRAYSNAEIAPGSHYVEFPKDAVWIF